MIELFLMVAITDRNMVEIVIDLELQRLIVRWEDLIAIYI